MANLLEEKVCIGISEYKKMVSDSTKLQVIIDLMEKEDFVSRNALHSILGIKKEGGGT